MKGAKSPLRREMLGRTALFKAAEGYAQALGRWIASGDVADQAVYREAMNKLETAAIVYANGFGQGRKP